MQIISKLKKNKNNILAIQGILNKILTLVQQKQTDLQIQKTPFDRIQLIYLIYEMEKLIKMRINIKILQF